MLTLGIDTSNYATSLAVVDTSRGEVVSFQKNLLPVPDAQRGLRQRDAVFHHTLALPCALQAACADVDIRSIETVGVSEKPKPEKTSYMPCFLPGVSFAQAFCAGRGVPLFRTTHQQGHLAAALFGVENRQKYDDGALFFHVSGGTTELLLTEGGAIRSSLLKTLDLYAGQAVDRLGVLLGYPFPAGGHISALAARCGGEVMVPGIVLDGGNCHLSGLENQCKTLLNKGKSAAFVAKYCLLFIAETLAGMLREAKKTYPLHPVLCAGGVLCSECVRERLTQIFPDIAFASARLSADNAVGVACMAADAAEKEGFSSQR